jgi:hypothetical protein
MIRGCAVVAVAVVALGLGACAATPKASSLKITSNSTPKITTTVPKVTTTTTTVAPPTTTTTTAPPPTTTAAPPTTMAPVAPTGCFKDPEGNCYKAGQLCPSSLSGQTVQGASGPLQCVNNNGWRWEAA